MNNIREKFESMSARELMLQMQHSRNILTSPQVHPTIKTVEEKVLVLAMCVSVERLLGQYIDSKEGANAAPGPSPTAAS